MVKPTSDVSNEAFLFSYIAHASDGRVDWQKVADECGIVSKAAAAMKFQRMKQKFTSTRTADGAKPADSETQGDEAGDEQSLKTLKKVTGKRSTKKVKKRKPDEGAGSDEDALS